MTPPFSTGLGGWILRCRARRLLPRLITPLLRSLGAISCTCLCTSKHKTTSSRQSPKRMTDSAGQVTHSGATPIGSTFTYISDEAKGNRHSEPAKAILTKLARQLEQVCYKRTQGQSKRKETP